jgi:hypothetical protein
MGIFSSKPAKPAKEAKADELKKGLFKHGILTPRSDNQRGANEGLSRREIKDLSAENFSPWGRSSLREQAIKDRGQQAQRGRK